MKWARQPPAATAVNLGNPLAADLFECINFANGVDAVSGTMPTQVGYAPPVASIYGVGQTAVSDTNFVKVGNPVKWLGDQSTIGGLKTFRFCFVTPATVAVNNMLCTRSTFYNTGELTLSLNASWQTDTFAQWNQTVIGGATNLGLGASAYQELVIVTAGTPGTTSQTMSIYNRGNLITTISAKRWDAANNSNFAQWKIGSNAGGSGFSTIKILPLQLQTWKKTSLSAAQVASLAADPWQLWAPPPRRIFLGITAAAEAPGSSGMQTGAVSHPGRGPRRTPAELFYQTPKAATDTTAPPPTTWAPAPSTIVRPGRGPRKTPGLLFVSRTPAYGVSAADNPLVAPLGTLTLTGLLPAFNQTQGILAPLGTLTLTGLVPTFGQGNAIAAPLGTLTLTGLLPAFNQTQGITAPLGTLTLTGLLPAFNQTQGITAPLGTLTLTGLLPAFNQTQGITAPLGTLTLTGLLPTFAQSSGNTLVAPLGTLTLTGLLPTFNQTQGILAPLGTLTLTGLIPTFSQGNGIVAPLGTLTLTGLVPSFAQTAGNLLNVPLGTITLVGLVPAFGQSHSIAVPLGTITLTGLVPSFIQGGAYILPALEPTVFFRRGPSRIGVPIPAPVPVRLGTHFPDPDAARLGDKMADPDAARLGDKVADPDAARLGEKVADPDPPNIGGIK